jgi:hypothetical protein
LMDLNNIVFSVVGIQFSKSSAVDDKFESFVRFMTLNCIRSWKSKFPEYDELVLCDDCSDKSWRKKEFKHYKASRKTKRKASKIDWDAAFVVTDKIKKEIQNNLPYKYVKADKAEADDIIATIATYSAVRGEDVLIISGDKDFKQIHSEKIKQYSPVKKDWVTCDDPQQYLAEHILTGDIADGVPNCLSDDDTFVVEGKRQVPLRKKKVQEFLTEGVKDKDLKKNYERNKKMIDFSMIPDKVCLDIFKAFHLPPKGSKTKLRKYLEQHDLQQIIKNIKDF